MPAPDPAIQRLARYHRLADASDGICPAAADSWAEVTRTKPATINGAIALLEELKDGDDEPFPEILRNVLEFLYDLARN